MAKYKAMVRIWTDSPEKFFADYVTGEVSGIAHETQHDAILEIEEEIRKEPDHPRMDYYVAEVEDD